MNKRLKSILHGIGCLSILWFPYLYLVYLPAALYFEKKNKIFVFGGITFQLLISIFSNTEGKWQITAVIAIMMFFASDIHEYFSRDKSKKPL
ncbi:hypothetical protein [Paenibacillus wynnii]|uniref:Uncharacterized protein n=1 Tax=Paenibacillus wynnii TaxID=268407 RepID=A0A098MCA1_9BACL|nr:hypothetical protein [Paenibacillus wynnii]KGE19678.1 hypothetical protein PWYN_10230 [Paenibacillus wynnii]